MNNNFYLQTKPSLVMGVILSWLRQHAGLDQRSLAEVLGITQASWSRIENGNAVPNFEQIINSCVAMGIDFVYLAKLYSYICEQLTTQLIDVTPKSQNLTDAEHNEVKKIIKEVLARHALMVSNKALNSDEKI